MVLLGMTLLYSIQSWLIHQDWQWFYWYYFMFQGNLLGFSDFLGATFNKLLWVLQGTCSDHFLANNTLVMQQAISLIHSAGIRRRVSSSIFTILSLWTLHENSPLFCSFFLFSLLYISLYSWFLGIDITLTFSFQYLPN